MPPHRKVASRQMDLLIDFAETRRDLALGRVPAGIQNGQAVWQAWESIANTLNSVAGGLNRTPGQWRRFWIEFKAKSKMKAADSRRSNLVVCGGANKLVPLNDWEKRVLRLIHPGAAKRSPDGRKTNSKIPKEEPVSPKSSPKTSNICEDCLEDADSSGLTTPTLNLFDLVEQAEVKKPRPVVTEAAAAGNTDQDEVPTWFYDLEKRRLDGENRIATALERLIDIESKRLVVDVQIATELSQLRKDIKNKYASS